MTTSPSRTCRIELTCDLPAPPLLAAHGGVEPPDGTCIVVDLLLASAS